MALEIRQTQKLAQKLVLTQQLQQAIELLVLNSQELVEAVNKELLENPALEEVPGSRTEQFSEAENALQEQAAKPGQDTAEQNNGSQEEAGIDWNRVLEERRKEMEVHRPQAEVGTKTCHRSRRPSRRRRTWLTI